MYTGFSSKGINTVLMARLMPFPLLFKRSAALFFTKHPTRHQPLLLHILFENYIFNPSHKLTAIMSIDNSSFEQIPFEQIPFGSQSFADNPEPRCPCVLLLDRSGSMAGEPIYQLNEGVKTFKQELLQDSLATKRVEVAVISFGPVSVESEFTSVPGFNPFPLQAGGDTPMGAAITRAIDMVTRRKQEYREHGVAYYKPWIILITDGAPTDGWIRAAHQVTEGEAKRSFAFFAIGIEGADMSTLAQISTARSPLKLRGLMFREFFLWLSASMKQVSSKNPGTAVNLLPPTGWSEL